MYVHCNTTMCAQLAVYSEYMYIYALQQLAVCVYGRTVFICIMNNNYYIYIYGLQYLLCRDTLITEHGWLFPIYNNTEHNNT